MPNHNARPQRMRGKFSRYLPTDELIRLLPKTPTGKLRGQVATFRVEVDITIETAGLGEILLVTELLLHAVRYGTTGRGQVMFYSRVKDTTTSKWGGWARVPGRVTASGGQYEDAARFLAQCNAVQIMQAETRSMEAEKARR